MPGKTLAGRLKGYFVTGLIAVLPILLTILVLKWVSGLVNGYIGPQTVFGRVLQKIGYKFSPISNLSLAYVLGVLLLIGFIFLLGMLLESRARKTMSGIAQQTLFRLPLLGTIYRTTDKFVNLMPSGNDDNVKGMQVVYCSFGLGAYSPGSLCLLPSPEVFNLAGKPHVIVMIPTAPVPVGGAMLFVPADSVFSTDMSMDAFAGSFLSMGVTTPQFSIGNALSETDRPAVGAKPASAIASSSKS